MPASKEQVRLLTLDDIPAIERLLRTSEYIYQRFTVDELSRQLNHYPSVGLFNGTTLHAFLLSQVLHMPSAWIGGFGVSWTESGRYLTILYRLLDEISTHLLARGVRYLHYSGNDMTRDWLRTTLLTRGFVPYRQLYAYDKFDYSIPTGGNQQVTIRPVNLVPGPNNDMAALLQIESACFEELWRYDSTAFADIAQTHPYFMVAEVEQRVIGYQFNTLESDSGYLVRIAVHPSVNGRGIGARLMAEAIRFFAAAKVSRIMLNTQDDNTHAHRLYEWFGFVRLSQIGFVLRKYL